MSARAISDPPARDRAIGAVWFAGWAMLAAGLMYLHPVVASGRVLEGVLFVVLPGLAALPVGAWLGPRFLDLRIAGPWKSAGFGLLVAMLAHVVFAPLFAFGWWLTEPGDTSVLAVAWATASFGFLMVGPITLPVGALAGWLLYLIGRYR
ncbi:MAG: hypothetical protein WD397_06325 [Wenzhouxiangellaceae bacterium]